MISAIDIYQKKGHHETFVDNPATVERVVTLENYARMRCADASLPALKKRIGSYKKLLEKIHDGKNLADIDYLTRDEFLTMANFFYTLEENYDVQVRRKWFDSFSEDDD